MCEVIFFFTDYTGDSAINDEHGACAAGCHTTVKGCILKGYTQSCSLAYGILLGMHGANTMLADAAVLMDDFFHQMSDIVTMRQSDRRSDISRDE
jgi:hypothetical protein